MGGPTNRDGPTVAETILPTLRSKKPPPIKATRQPGSLWSSPTPPPVSLVPNSTEAAILSSPDSNPEKAFCGNGSRGPQDPGVPANLCLVSFHKTEEVTRPQKGSDEGPPGPRRGPGRGSVVTSPLPTLPLRRRRANRSGEPAVLSLATTPWSLWHCPAPGMSQVLSVMFN